MRSAMLISEDRKPQSRTTGQKIKWILGVCAVMLVILLMVRWNTAMMVPTIVIPTPTLPTPNAFDTFVGAGNQMLDDHKAGYAISSSAQHTSGDRDDRVYSQAEKDTLVSENAQTLAALRQGLAQEYMNPPARSFSALFPYYARFRSLARLTLLEAQVRGAHGDWGGAMNSHLDSIRLGTQIPRGSP